MQRLALTLGAAVTLALAPPAAAAHIEVAASDDGALSGQTDTLTPALRQSAPNVKRIRVFAMSNHPLPDLAVNRALGAGYRVQIVAWAGPAGKSPMYPTRPATTGEVARWSGKVAGHFRGRVSRYSIGNEPDLFTAAAIEKRGDIYAAQYRKGYAAIKRANPRAKVLAGELSPITKTAKPFLATFLKHRLTADGFAYHGYSYRALLLGMKWLPKLNRALARGAVRTPHGRTPPVYVTEYAFAPGTANVAAKIAAGIKIARATGARQITWYQVVRPVRGGWDTSLQGDAASVAAFARATR